MIDLASKLPFWLSGAELRKLSAAAQAYWARAEGWLNEALAQAVVSTCSEEALIYHATDRGVVRLPNEPFDIWRARVQHAQRTAIESGSRQGLEEILSVYGVGFSAVLERQPGQDWDIIEIRLSPTALDGADTDTLDKIFHRWGRVCRRYVIAHIDPATVNVYSFETTELQTTEVAA